MSEKMSEKDMSTHCHKEKFLRKKTEKWQKNFFSTINLPLIENFNFLKVSKVTAERKKKRDKRTKHTRQIVGRNFRGRDVLQARRCTR